MLGLCLVASERGTEGSADGKTIENKQDDWVDKGLEEQHLKTDQADLTQILLAGS